MKKNLPWKITTCTCGRIKYIEDDFLMSLKGDFNDFLCNELIVHIYLDLCSACR